MQYWLMKSEPDVFSIDHLERDGVTLWEGVRNYQARNFMMNDMRDGDTVFFYHSNAEPPGIAGLGTVVAPAIPDPQQFLKKSEYYDEKATKEKPRWFCVKVKFKKKFKNILSRAELKAHPVFKDMLVTRPAQRLSIQPVEKKHAELLLKTLK
jgi:predicted RNA-binding protein with PUA-like domain